MQAPDDRATQVDAGDAGQHGDVGHRLLDVATASVAAHVIAITSPSRRAIRRHQSLARSVVASSALPHDHAVQLEAGPGHGAINGSTPLTA